MPNLREPSASRAHAQRLPFFLQDVSLRVRGGRALREEDAAGAERSGRHPGWQGGMGERGPDGCTVCRVRQQTRILHADTDQECR